MISLQIKLSILWICTMLTFLLGDVLRIFTGDFKPGEIEGVKITGGMALGIAMLMVIPIIMVFLSIVLPDNVNKWMNIIVAVFFLLFNLIALPGYRLYDQFLLVISMVFNIITIYYAWNWKA